VRRLSLVLALVLAALTAAAPAEAAKRRPVKRQLTAFRSCDGLVAFAERRARRFGSDVYATRRPVSGGGLVAPRPGVAERQDAAAGPSADGAQPAAPVEGTDYSGTNVQEAGVDEPDAVKTDGRRLFVAMNQRLYAIDLTGDQPRLAASLPLEGDGHELLLRGGKLLVLSSGGFEGPMPMPVARPEGDGAPPPYVYAPRARLLEVDAGTLKVIRTLELPGTVVGGRLRGSTARVAIATPTGIAPEGAPELRRWLPAMAVTPASTGRPLRRSIARCSAVRRPAIFAGLGLLTVLTIDLDRGVSPVDSDAILADASTVYASKDRMYLATERWVDSQDAQEDGVPVGRSTAIHGFDVADAGRTAYAGSGTVRGYLLNQFSLSEYRGALRVATTEEPSWLGDVGADRRSESFVTVLDERPAGLAQVGRVGGLGRGERIYAVRFAGDAGFVVTFRQTDPLYTLDLSRPASPRVAGELKIPGYSSYLHPIGGGLMLGVGQDADADGRVRGAQVSLFDVGDLSDPRRLHQLRFGRYASTLAEHDHHAFLWWPAAKLLVLPLAEYGDRSEDAFLGAVGLRVDRAAGFAEAGRTEHPDVDGYRPQVVRAAVVDGRLYTISYAGVQAGRLDTLAGTAWVAFPQP
jgi:uncharacterized secreted protein with C-terminal beta-propeller domain